MQKLVKNVKNPQPSMHVLDRKRRERNYIDELELHHALQENKEKKLH